MGNDNSIDSSIWFAISRHLTEDGEHDPTLDFGFVKAESEEPTDPETPGEPGEEPTDPETPGEPGEESTDPENPEESGKKQQILVNQPLMEKAKQMEIPLNNRETLKLEKVLRPIKVMMEKHCQVQQHPCSTYCLSA